MIEPNGPPPPDIIQKQADEVVDKFPDASLESLAVDLETDAVDHGETAEMALALAVELRMRASAGVRKWSR
jgi:hypothetical protein